jgi:hypothetical protein
MESVSGQNSVNVKGNDEFVPTFLRASLTFPDEEEDESDFEMSNFIKLKKSKSTGTSGGAKRRRVDFDDSNPYK